MKAKNLKGLFSKLNGYGDDALRMASNYGDNVSDLTRALAPGGASAKGIVNPYLGIPEETLSQLRFRDATDKLYDSAAAFKQNMNDRFQTNMSALQDRFDSLGRAVDDWGVKKKAELEALSGNLHTPKSNIAVEMGDPPPLVDDFTPSIADNDWLTQDLLSRGVLDEGTHYGNDVSQLVASFGDNYLDLPFIVDPDTMSKIINSKRVPHNRLSEMYVDLRDNLRRFEQDYRYTSGASGLPPDDRYDILDMLSPFKPVEDYPF